MEAGVTLKSTNFWSEWALAIFRAWTFPWLVLSGMESPAVDDPTFNLKPEDWECDCCGHKILGGPCHCKEIKNER